MANGKNSPKTPPRIDWDAIAPRLSSFELAETEWLWPGFIQKRAVTILEGDPGEGKSNFVAWLVAALSTGEVTPNGHKFDVESSLLIDVENAPDSTLLPRVLNNGGNADHVRLVHWFQIPGSGQRTLFQLPEHLDVLVQLIIEFKPALIVIDTLMNHLSPNISARDDQKVRSALSPLADIAHRFNVAILILRHLNKSDTKNAKYKGAGSVGIGGVARQVLLVGPDPDNEEIKVLCSVKENNSKKPKSLQFDMLASDNGAPKVLWLGYSERTAADLTDRHEESSEESALDSAVNELREMLKDGPVPYNNLVVTARYMAISIPTLRRAKEKLKVIAEKVGNGSGSYWQWRLPPDEGIEMLN